MSIIKKSEIAQMNNEQVQSKVKELKKEMMKINAQRSSKTVPENPGRVKEVRRTIARLLTKSHKNIKEVLKKNA